MIYIENTSFARIRRIFQLHAKKFEYYLELCVWGGGGGKHIVELRNNVSILWGYLNTWEFMASADNACTLEIRD